MGGKRQEPPPLFVISSALIFFIVQQSSTTMTQLPEESVTQLLVAVREGNNDALNDLFPLVYGELRALAHRKRQAWHGDYTLNTTALVHEAYIKLVDQSHAEWTSRAHFFGVAAKAMRHIQINYAKHRHRKKRGGDVQKVSLDDLSQLFEAETPLTEERAEALISLDEALSKLEHVSERQSRIVECRFFGGMTIDETAAALELSPATVKRGWAMAQAWLHRTMKETA